AFKITNSAGGQRTINLGDGNAKTLGDVITRINAAGAGVTASINANGDGLLLTDTAAGAGKMKVENTSGTTARDLNILGEAATAAGPIDGSFEKTIAVTATDTLTTVADKIRTLGYGASASVINDGSGVAPFRLSLTAFNSGKNGRVTFDAGTTGLDAQTLVQAQDAAVFVGGVGAAQPLLVTSGTNQITGVIPGVNIELNGVSTQPVTLNVGRDPQKLVDEVQKFVDGFNEVTGAITELTKYDTTTQKGGLLLGESAAQRTETELYLSVQGVVVGAGRYRSLADVGITIGDGAKLDFDADKFKSALATDPEAVKNMFTQVAAGLTPSTALTTLNNGRGVRVAGAGKPDFKVALRDGTSFNVTLPADGTVNDLVNAIATGSGGKATATVNDTGKGLKVVDNTAGGTTFAITTLNGSSAAADLGIAGTWPAGTASGSDVFTNRALQTGGGFGYMIERRLNILVDPVDGILTRQKNEIDTKNRAFDKRMSDLDDLLKTKRARLERQFANMESVLAGLQSQQSALGSLSSVKAA
ncbi:MAG TPA: flagellar filament capping protein FliD, partial [Humisphaera sp.]